MKLSEIATRLARPLVCAVYGHERWPFAPELPLMAFAAGPEMTGRVDSPRVELELCRRCGTLYVTHWHWRQDYRAPPAQVQTSANESQTEAA